MVTFPLYSPRYGAQNPIFKGRLTVTARCFNGFLGIPLAPPSFDTPSFQTETGAVRMGLGVKESPFV
jgi:hypothetical protein